jgi:hypothetical protein
VVPASAVDRGEARLLVCLYPPQNQCFTERERLTVRGRHGGARGQFGYFKERLSKQNTAH